MTNMLVYLIGTLFVVAGLAYAANRMGVSRSGSSRGPSSSSASA